MDGGEGGYYTIYFRMAQRQEYHFPRVKLQIVFSLPRRRLFKHGSPAGPPQKIELQNSGRAIPPKVAPFTTSYYSYNQSGILIMSQIHQIYMFQRVSYETWLMSHIHQFHTCSKTQQTPASTPTALKSHIHQFSCVFS